MPPFAPAKQAPIDFAPNFGMSKKKLIASLSLVAKNDISASAPKVTPEIVSPKIALEKSLNPMSTIGQVAPVQTAPSPVPVDSGTVPTGKPSMGDFMSGILGIPKANAGESILNQYLADKNIPDENKKYAQEQLSNGDISQGELEKMIVEKYYSKGMPENQQTKGTFQDRHPTESTIGQAFMALPRAIGNVAGGTLEAVGTLGQGATNLLSKGYQSISNAITGKETPATQFENPYTAIKNEVQGNTQANLEPTSVGKDISKIGAGASTAAFNLVKAPLSVGIQTASELPGAQYLMQAIGKGIDIGADELAKATGIDKETASNTIATVMNTIGVKSKGLSTAQAVEGAKNIAGKISDTAPRVQGQGGFVKVPGKGYTEKGMEIDIPEMSTMDKIKYMPNKSPEALMKEDAMGNTPLSRTAAESMKIGNAGKSTTGLQQNQAVPFNFLRTIHELVRTGKVEGSLDTMTDTSKAVIDAMSKIGKELGDIRQRTSGETLDTSGIAQLGDKVINSKMQSVTQGPGFSELSRFHNDLNKVNSFDDLWNLKTDLGSEMEVLRKQGYGGKTTYSALRDMNEELGKKLDSYLENDTGLTGEELAKYRENMQDYSKLKAGALPFLKSTAIDLQRSDLPLYEALTWRDGLSPTAIPGKIVGKTFDEIIKSRGTREGAMKRTFAGLDKIAQERIPDPSLMITTTTPTIGEKANSLQK